MILYFYLDDFCVLFCIFVIFVILISVSLVSLAKLPSVVLIMFISKTVKYRIKRFTSKKRTNNSMKD